MAQTESATVQQGRPTETALRGFSFRELPKGFLEATSVSAGMATNLPREEVPAGSAERIKNGRVRNKWTGRRGGLKLLMSNADANRVTGIVTFVPISGEPWVVRVSPSKIHAAQSTDGWTEFTPTGDAKQSVERGIDSTQFLNNLYIVDGYNKPIELSFDNHEYTIIEDDFAARAKHITAFGDRLILANFIDKIGADRPTTIRWSKRLDASEWDASEEITAGEVALAATPSHFGDAITGLHALDDVVVILRKGSIWHAERQAVASAPFRFRQTTGGVGCDMPLSSAKVPGGVIFASAAHNGIFFYQPGRRPQRISTQIEDQLFDGIKEIEHAQGAYDPVHREYHLGISTDSGKDIEKIWVYSLRHNAWSFDDSPTITALSQTQLAGDLTLIDELSGTIDNLTGDIDDLSPDIVNNPLIFKGTDTGAVLYHDGGEITDWDGSAFEFDFISPNLGHAHRRRTLNQLMVWFETQGIASGDVTLEESKDLSTWRNSRTDTGIGGSAGRHQVGIGYKQIHGADLYWRLRSTNLDVRITNWWAKMLEHNAHSHE